MINVVYHLVPTSNHNMSALYFRRMIVVYHLVPTSNHNLNVRSAEVYLLFIILFLHQTTTTGHCFRFRAALFIILFLHQTTTYSCKSTGNQ